MRIVWVCSGCPNANKMFFKKTKLWAHGQKNPHECLEKPLVPYKADEKGESLTPSEKTPKMPPALEGAKKEEGKKKWNGSLWCPAQVRVGARCEEIGE